jgi:hypothetical protein
MLPPGHPASSDTMRHHDSVVLFEPQCSPSQIQLRSIHRKRLAFGFRRPYQCDEPEQEDER